METILVPTDFSPAATNALNYAVELAKVFDAEIILVNAYPIPIVTETGLPLNSVPLMRDSAYESLETLKKDLILKHNNYGLNIRCYAEMGIPYDVIEQAVHEYKPEMIVMGIVGEAGILKEKIIGTTATKVARQLKIPTFIIPENFKYRIIKKMAFSCDFENTEETTIPNTLKYFANLFNAEINILHITKPKEEISVKKANSIKFLEDSLKEIHHSTVFINDINVGKGIEDYVRNHEEDLIITNPKKHNVFHYLFNENVTKELTFHSPLPILAIHSH